MKTNNQIDQLEASERMAKEFKEISTDIHRLSENKNFAGVLQLFVNTLINQIENGQISKVTRRIQIIGKLYRIGNESIKFLIENLFVGSLRGLKRRSNCMQWSEIYVKMPISIRSMYIRQNQQFNTRAL